MSFFDRFKKKHNNNCILQVKDEKPPAPTLGLSPKGADDEEGGEDEGDGGGGDAAAPTVNLADLVPRNDIRYIVRIFLNYVAMSLV